jgi:alkylation response protein AidB-like acyl-CoA dehydrogenase
MDFELTEEQKALVALAKDFCKRALKPELLSELITRSEPRDRVPWDVMKKMHDVGFLTVTVPERYGGWGADLLTRVLLADTLAQSAAPGTAALLAPNLLMFNWKMCGDLAAVATEEQQDEFFARVTSDHTFSMGEIATEPDHGLDPILPYDEPGSGLATYAYRDGDEYVVNGEKCFCGNGTASMLWVFVRTDKKKPLSQSMSILLVPTDTPGFSIQKVNEFISTPLGINADLLFDNMRVPVRYLVGEENKGFAIFEGRRAFWLAISAFEIGTAQAIYEYTKEYAKTRVQGGKPIFEHLTVGTRIVDMLLHIEQARYLVYKTAWEYDQAVKSGGPLVSSLGFNLCNAALRDLGILVAEHAAEVFGGRAALKELPIEGYIRSVYGGHHAFGTGTFNRIKSMNMI